MIGAHLTRGRAVTCLATLLLALVCDGPAYSRERRPQIRACTGLCPAPTNPHQMIGPDGQPYGLRSGGEGPLNASGSYGAVLEGRNPVGSTGF